jgi:hypothetical protein
MEHTPLQHGAYEITRIIYEEVELKIENESMEN